MKTGSNMIIKTNGSNSVTIGGSASTRELESVWEHAKEIMGEFKFDPYKVFEVIVVESVVIMVIFRRTEVESFIINGFAERMNLASWNIHLQPAADDTSTKPSVNSLPFRMACLFVRKEGIDKAVGSGSKGVITLSGGVPSV